MSLQTQLCFLFLINLLCIVDGNEKFRQKISSTKSVDKTVVIDCHYPSDCIEYIHWYQLKEGQTLRRILYSSIASGSTSNDAGFELFKIDKKQSNLALKIPELKKEHSAIYYCACWVSGGRDKKVFGSGTRLYVTAPGDDQTKAPVLSAYLPSVQKSDEQTMVCQASGMFPDLVKFTWKKKTKTNDWAEVSANNVVEQRNETPNEKPNGKPNVIVTSMIIDKTTAAENPEYNCTVEHESSKETITKALKKKGEERSPKEIIQGTVSPTVTEKTLQRQNSVASEQMPGLNLFVHAYGIMLMKNGAYFCAISIFLLKRKFEKKE